MKPIEVRSNCVLGVSGGADSMFLLHHYRHAKNIQVVHMNYGVRLDSDQDELLVKEYCDRYEISCHTKRIKVDPKGNFEAAARDARYRMFNRVMDFYGLNHIVTAHNADDQSETFLMRMLRGTGLQGMSCIHRDDGVLFRPLLDWSKDEIYDECKRLDIPYREDSTNADTNFLRNWFRHSYDTKPMTKSIGVIVDTMQGLLPRLMSMATELYAGKIFLDDHNRLWISKELEPDMLFHFYVSKFFTDRGLSYETCERMFSTDPSTRHFDLGGGIRCNKLKKNWIIIEFG